MTDDRPPREGTAGEEAAPAAAAAEQPAAPTLIDLPTQPTLPQADTWDGLPPARPMVELPAPSPRGELPPAWSMTDRPPATRAMGELPLSASSTLEAPSPSPVVVEFAPDPSGADSLAPAAALANGSRVPAESGHGIDIRLTRPGIRLEDVKEEFIAWVKTLLSAAVYAVLIVTFAFQVARVEGQSMAPTLQDQDRLIVNKLIYRIGEPRRGDIVMLYYPVDPSKSFVKRVIAEEGDKVQIIEGRVYVNDLPLQDDYVKPEFRSHDDFGPKVIEAGYDFVMGDHRNNSSDSRHWGSVPKKYIIGKVQLRWWPIPAARIF